MPKTRKASHGFRRAFFARPRPLHLLILVIFIVFGTALVTQVRAQRTDPLDTLSDQDLVELLGELDQREDALQEQRSDLQKQIRELDDQVDAQAKANEAAEKVAFQAQVAAGLVPVEGPGIVLQVDSGEDDVFPASIFITTMTELRNSGAEAIELNGNRLTLTSWFATADGNVIVDGKTIRSPFIWKAVGTADTLASALEIRGGAAAQIRAYGGEVDITRSDKIAITVVADQHEPKWATIEQDS